MNPARAQSWSRDIRRQVIELVGILITLVLAAAGYDIWTKVSVDAERDQINNYHLIANSHYLRAMEELRKLQAHHGLLLNQTARDANPGTGSPLALSDSHHSVLHYLVKQEIDSGLALEQAYSDSGFHMLGARLAQQNMSLAESYSAFEVRTIGDSKVLQQVEALLITLEQIVRLHSITRDSTLMQLQQTEKLQDQIFYILMVLLLIVAVVVARRGFRSINRIIRNQQEAEATIQRQAHYDNLTQLPNRFLALDRLSQMMKEARRNHSKVAVLFIDLDFFKKVNDLLGHSSGDKLLVEAAARIRDSVRDEDTVGRLGGDEFIVLGGGIAHANEVMRIAENLIANLARTFVIDDREIILSASIGISVFPDDGEDKLELIRKADSAMYLSKESGRNTFSYFTDSINRKLSRQLEVEDQIRGALERGEFHLQYQQKVDLADNNRIIGAEALLRWNNDALGAVAPDEFIPVAEQTGLIVPIGEFVLGEALKMTAQWRAQLAPEFKIAVNLSPRQFRDPGLIDSISRALHVAGVPSDCLELEITEGVLMSEYIHIDRALSEITRLGIKIAMDDFGTGYSSLSYLRKYPFDVIKIDRSFIDGIEGNSMCLKLNHAAIAMAHALNILVVAEGVETHTQFALLQSLQCDIAQGYYFGRPVSATEMADKLRAEGLERRRGDVVDISERPALRPPGSAKT